MAVIGIEDSASDTRDGLGLVRVAFWVLALAPVLAAILFYSFVLRAYLTLGRWPMPYHPDPKELGFSVHYHAALLSPLIAAASGVGLAMLVILLGRDLKRGGIRPVVGTVIWLVAVVLLVVAWRLDPGNFTTWLGD